MIMAEIAENGAGRSIEEARDGLHDFDFLIGKWNVHHKRLTKPLGGSSSSHEFEGESVARAIRGGGDNIDEISGDAPQWQIKGMTLRLYDRKSKQWRIYWANMANGVLDEVPMMGEFKNGRGEFYDQKFHLVCSYSGLLQMGTGFFS
jgi:hypothetical protein